MLQNGKMERRTKVLKIGLMRKSWKCWWKFNLAIKLWRTMFLKIYIKETQERIYIFKVKKLLFFLHLRIYQLFFFYKCLFHCQTPTGRRRNPYVNTWSQNYAGYLQIQFDNNTISVSKGTSVVNLFVNLMLKLYWIGKIFKFQSSDLA